MAVYKMNYPPVVQALYRMTPPRSRGKDTPGDERVYERLTAVRPIPYFRLKCVISPGATFGQANNRAYFSPEALVSRGKTKKNKKQNKIKNLKKRKKEKKI